MLLTRVQVAGRLAVSLETVRKLTRAGVLRAVPIGRRGIRYRERDVAAVERLGVRAP